MPTALLVTLSGHSHSADFTPGRHDLVRGRHLYSLQATDTNVFALSDDTIAEGAASAHVVVFTTSPNKKDDAFRLGADEVVVSRNANEMRKHTGSFDFILDAVSADHDINAYINLLRRDGNIMLVGAPEKPLAVAAFGLLMGRRSLSGSPIGGIAETQEMLDF
jgi:D-arabinose 1-dehydrogenase-like Zn-dependent alcohol dehydrogenase